MYSTCDISQYSSHHTHVYIILMLKASTKGELVHVYTYTHTLFLLSWTTRLYKDHIKYLSFSIYNILHHVLRSIATPSVCCVLHILQSHVCILATWGLAASLSPTCTCNTSSFSEPFLVISKPYSHYTQSNYGYINTTLDSKHNVCFDALISCDNWITSTQG